MNCTLCDTPLSLKVDVEFFDCPSCKALVRDSVFWLAPDLEKAHYQTHQNNVFDIRYQKFVSPITDYVLKEYTPFNFGLDFGSGTGPVISKVLQDYNFQIEQFDPYFAPNHQVLNSQYDYIVSCEVAEHFYNPKLEFERLRNMLNLNGRLIFMTLLFSDHIDFRTWFYKKDPTHVFLYRKETIQFIAERYSFNLEHISERVVVLRKMT